MPVPVTTPVPAELVVPCVIESREVRTYGDAVDVALAALAALTACEDRMAQIRSLE